MFAYIIYTPNLGFAITLPGREREQGRFRGSSEGAWGRSEGALERSKRAKGGAAREKRFWLLREPDLAAFYSATAAPVIYPAVLPGSACWCLEFYSFVGS